MTPEILDAYRLPQLVRGWEWGLLRFLRARVAGEYLFSPDGTMSSGPFRHKDSCNVGEQL